MLKRIRNQKGFTLIELLIVIVIIGILAGIVIGLTGSSARRKANDADRKAELHEVQNALEQYFIDNNGAYPADLATLVTAGTLTNDKTTDPTNVAYGYTPVNGTTYTLTSTLENSSDSGPNVVNGVYTLTQKQ